MMSSVTEADRRCRWMARLLSFLRVSGRIVRVMYGLIIHRVFFYVLLHTNRVYEWITGGISVSVRMMGVGLCQQPTRV